MTVSLVVLTHLYSYCTAPLPPVFVSVIRIHVVLFFFNDTATTEIYTLSLHYALLFFFNEPAPPELSPLPLPAPLPIPRPRGRARLRRGRRGPSRRAGRHDARPDGAGDPAVRAPGGDDRGSPGGNAEREVHGPWAVRIQIGRAHV